MEQQQNSKFGHNIEDLLKIKYNGTSIYLMHIDDKEYISSKCNGEFEIK